MVRVEIQPFHASLRTMATSYSKLKELITLRVSMSEMHSQILHAMKGLYQNDINSARRYEQITTIGQLLKVLELRDVLSEENILPLQVLAQRLPENMEVMNNITCYEQNCGPKQNINQYGTNVELQNDRLMTFKSLVEDDVSLTCNLLYKNGIIHPKKQRKVRISERKALKLANSKSFSKLNENAMIMILRKLLMIMILEQIVTFVVDIRLSPISLICIHADVFRSALNSLIEDYRLNQIIAGKNTAEEYTQQTALPKPPLKENEDNAFSDGLCEKKRERITETIVEEIGSYWRNLARYLGIQEWRIDEIQCNGKPIGEKAAEIMEMYKKRADRKKWFFDLLDALEKSRRRELCKKIREIATMNI